MRATRATAVAFSATMHMYARDRNQPTTKEWRRPNSWRVKASSPPVTGSTRMIIP